MDVGGWFSSRTAVVQASRLRAGQDADGDWHVDLTKEELEAAPTSEERDGGHVFDVASLPPVLTGPFGNTISPALIYAGLLSEAEEESGTARRSGLMALAEMLDDMDSDDADKLEMLAEAVRDLAG